MEGLIPFLLHTLKKQRPHNSYRSVSASSSRSYHLLTGAGGGGDSADGSSHRRTRSEFQPLDFSKMGSGLDFVPPHSRSLNKGSPVATASNANGSRQIGSNTTSNLRR
ncbi:hypothetical protein RJ640_018644 [Escallonia rubra]|uniref:Uncharacterized protein n=1 Tax=Escallonia rubra TaxID=112253 RepID=A0AA88QP89_9ASTE|nr:hypothetical protein RJ640_018644 [Escallonia rubra]